jgi:hypothetical protein
MSSEDINSKYPLSPTKGSHSFTMNKSCHAAVVAGNKSSNTGAAATAATGGKYKSKNLPVVRVTKSTNIEMLNPASTSASYASIQRGKQAAPLYDPKMILVSEGTMQVCILYLICV